MAFSFGRLLLLVNSVLLLAALCISLIFTVSWLAPKKVDQFGKRHLAKYLGAGQVQAAEAIAELQNGNPEEAKALLEEWQQFQSGDRYFAFKREVAIALANSLQASGSYQEVVDIMTPFMAQDDRDLVAFFIWAKAALNIEGLRETAAAQVTENWKRFPKSQTISELYLREVYAWNDPAHAKELVETYGYIKPVSRIGWEVFWGGSEGITPKNRKQAEFEQDGPGWTMTIDVPKGTRLLRLDAPPGQEMVIEDFGVHRLGDSSTVIGAEGQTLRMMTLENGVLKTDGGADPFIVVDVEALVEAADDQETVSLVVKLNAKSEFAGWLAKRIEGL